MINYIIRRLLISIALAFALTAIIFFMLRTIVPGDPAEVMAGENAPPSVVKQIRQNMGLDKPLLVQFGIFIENALHGDLGISNQNREPVTKRLLEAMPVTLHLTLYCFIYTMLLGIIVGVMTAYWHDTWLDNLLRVLTVTGASMPTFWLGLMLILVFAVYIGILPVFGSTDIRGMILPVLTLGTGSATYLARLVRSSMLEVLNSDYIRMARAKGVSETGVVLKHALRNTLIPILTVAGFQIGGLLGGAVITESIFGLPGMGTLSINSIQGRDYPVIQGTTLFIVLVYLFVNLLVDISYAYVDPRIRYN
ncbi:MAG: ABC transporter permease [Anaerolineaceae bacterium]|nr:ABC transporter permease [Anaerolineaceae bacterium]